jgi:hypothetical protein
MFSLCRMPPLYWCIQPHRVRPSVLRVDDPPLPRPERPDFPIPSVFIVSAGSGKHVGGNITGSVQGRVLRGSVWLYQCESNIVEATVDIVGDCRTNRRMCLRVGNIDRVCPVHRVAQALGNKAEIPACPSA